ncbi:MAG: hypothetical protein GKR89_27455 [Candidatus Latescibacteria bacterium]|nr:hypothetical protein [Candidatus Latescibacterota bacterium]
MNPPQLKVLTWNIWGRLNQDPRYALEGRSARQRTLDIIRASNADIIAMIETYGSAADLAQSLGYHCYTPDPEANLALFSRYPLSDVGGLSGLSTFSFIAATAQLPNGQSLRLYDIWLTSGGRHIVEIKNTDLSDAEFAAGDDIRHAQLEQFLAHPDLQHHLGQANQTPVLVAGDFNSVSHLDYTQKTKEAQLNYGRILDIKASQALADAGFIDSYRAVHPHITQNTLGHTWTTVGQGFAYHPDKAFYPVADNPEPHYRDPYTRIDFIYYAGQGLKPLDAQTIYHHPTNPSRSFPEFPSDHAAVLTTFALR